MSTQILKPFPQIDGHFWLERGGIIIDHDFDGYNHIKRVRKCSGPMIHHETDELTQKLMIKLFMTRFLAMGFTAHNFKEEMDVIAEGALPAQNCCFQNCMYAYKHGDVIKFGSAGWAMRDGQVFYEFGGKDWTGLKAFLK